MFLLSRIKCTPSLHPTISKVTASPFPMRKTSGLVHSLATLSCSQSASSSLCNQRLEVPTCLIFRMLWATFGSDQVILQAFHCISLPFPLNVLFLRRLSKEQTDLGWSEEPRSLRTVGRQRPLSGTLSHAEKEGKTKPPAPGGTASTQTQQERTASRTIIICPQEFCVFRPVDIALPTWLVFSSPFFSRRSHRPDHFFLLSVCQRKYRLPKLNFR